MAISKNLRKQLEDNNFFIFETKCQFYAFKTFDLIFQELNKTLLMDLAIHSDIITEKIIFKAKTFIDNKPFYVRREIISDWIELMIEPNILFKRELEEIVNLIQEELTK